MERLVIGRALDLVLEKEGRNFLILSDSRRALQSLEGRLFNIKTNRYIPEIKPKYLNFTPRYTEKTLEFLWIPSHSGIRENKEADALAKEASRKALPDIRTVPFTDLFQGFREKSISDSDEVLLEQALFKGTQHFEFFNGSSRRKP